MGCDIHLHIEIKVGGRWEHYTEAEIGRWYSLFGKMAGVRDHTVEPISPPKGIPDDMNIITKMDYDNWGSDGHSHSWFNKEEIITLYNWIQGLEGVDGDYFYLRFYTNKILDWNNPLLEDLRFVFWFDN